MCGIVIAEIRISLPGGKASYERIASSPVRTDRHVTLFGPQLASIWRLLSSPSPGMTQYSAAAARSLHEIASVPRGSMS